MYRDQFNTYIFPSVSRRVNRKQTASRTKCLIKIGRYVYVAHLNYSCSKTFRTPAVRPRKNTTALSGSRLTDTVVTRDRKEDHRSLPLTQRFH